MNISFFYILPEISLSLGIIIIIISGLLLNDTIKNIDYIFFQIFMIITFILIYLQKYLINTNTTIFNGQVIFSGFTYILELITIILAIFIAVYAKKYIQDKKILNNNFYILFTICILGSIILISGHSLIIIYLGLELLSLSLYTLIAISKKLNNSFEAAIKYFILGTIASSLLLFGISFIYGITGEFDIAKIGNSLLKYQSIKLNQKLLIICLILILTAFLFKLGSFPFHMWIPDVYQGAPNITINIISTIPKIASFAPLINILFIMFLSLKSYWIYLLKIISILSILFGSLAAIPQTNIKRLIGYSTISQIGFILLSITIKPQKYAIIISSFYIIIYVFTNLIIFGLITIISVKDFEITNINDLKGLNKNNSWISFLFLIAIFSMTGIPPFGGFIAKLFIIIELIKNNNYFLTSFILLMTVISSFYYIYIIKTIYFYEPKNKQNIKLSLSQLIFISINGLIILFLGIIPIPLLDFLKETINII